MNLSTQNMLAVAERTLPLIDLTNLNADCEGADIDRLADDSVIPQGHVAALCVWPQFVKQAKARMNAKTDIGLATVVNFPDGGETIEPVLQLTDEVIRDGANEIDLVWPYKAFLAGREDICRDMIGSVRDLIAGRALLKVILETGELGDIGRIAGASRLALDAGADFLKTSTGKTATGASLAAAQAMLEAIRDSESKAGFKASGGISTLEQAADYLQCADEIMGGNWVTPQTFRFGASSLLGAVKQAFDA